MTVLIIDDSRAMRGILRKIVAPFGFPILEAENGRVGLETLRANKDIFLVLVDWNMPEVNGLEFVEAVRAEDEYSKLALVMVTTETVIGGDLNGAPGERVFAPCG